VIAMLAAGCDGALGFVAAAVVDADGALNPNNVFWLTGLLSAFLDNAPNFMIKAVAEDRGVAMPSFFGYAAKAAVPLLPLLAIVGWRYL
jgi:Na+/H+ antiporter NhaD/arsenite permease-like protein